MIYIMTILTIEVVRFKQGDMGVRDHSGIVKVVVAVDVRKETVEYKGVRTASPFFASTVVTARKFAHERRDLQGRWGDRDLLGDCEGT